MAAHSAVSLDMEDCLDRVKSVLTEYLGEEGLGTRIVDDMRDCLRIDLAERILVEKRVNFVCQCMLANLESEIVCCAGLKALRTISKYRRDDMDSMARACREILDSNGIELILTSMSTHEASADIQRDGCIILLLLRLNDFARFSGWFSTSTENSLRGGRTFLKAVENHPQDREIQEDALRCLWYLIDSSSFRMNEALFQNIVQAGICPLLFRSMSLYADKSGIVLSAMRILGTMATSAVHHPVACEAVLSYTSTHPEWRSIVDEAVKKQNFPRESEDVRRRLCFLQGESID